MAAQVTSFGERLNEVFAELGPLCVGIDPHPHLLEAWGLRSDADSLRKFGLKVVQACAGVAGVVKPQLAFFERYGAAGMAAAAEVIAAARDAGLLVIADVKRGDIGSTMQAYAEAWLPVGSPFESDAITISPYLGVGSLRGTVELALAHGKGVFMLAATSNPEATALQQSKDERGITVARRVIEGARELNAKVQGTLGSVGLVVGATVNLADYGVDPGQLVHPLPPILAPGFGAQGAQVAQLTEIFGRLAKATVVAESRSILSAGPTGLRQAIEEHAAAARQAR